MADEPNPVIPSPDPSVMTTDALTRDGLQRDALVSAQLAIRDVRIDARQREVAAELLGLREMVLARLGGAIDQVTERLDGMDRANVVLSENVNRTPTLLQVAIENATTLNDVKFTALSDILANLRSELTSRFELLDRQTVREKAAADLAVNAAFAAADKAAAAAAAASTEAIRKSEAATAETIKTNEQARIAGNTALADKIDDDRDRMNRIEQLVNTISTQRTTQAEVRTDTRAQSGNVSQWVGIAVSVLVMLMLAVTTIIAVYAITRGA